MSESQQGLEICDVISEKHYSLDRFYLQVVSGLCS